MSLQRHLRGTLFNNPQPDGVVKAITGQQVSIGTPGDAFHLVRMSHQRLETPPASSLPNLPELDAANPTGACQHAAVRGEGQSAHQAAMPLKRLHTERALAFLHLPEPNRSL